MKKKHPDTSPSPLYQFGQALGKRLAAERLKQALQFNKVAIEKTPHGQLIVYRLGHKDQSQIFCSDLAAIGEAAGRLFAEMEREETVDKDPDPSLH